MDKRNFPTWIWYAVALVFALAVVGVGIYVVMQPPHDNWSMLAAGCICLAGVAISWPISLAIHANRACSPEQASHPITERLDQISILLNLMSEQQLLSDRAISIAYREKDREALPRGS